MVGKITKVIEEKGFFFVDQDYWCHFNNYNEIPEVGDNIEYERVTTGKGKNAKNARLISKSDNSFGQDIKNSPVIEKYNIDIMNEYLDFLKNGYFVEINDKMYLKEDLIIKYPQLLAKRFNQDINKNKISTVAQYFTYCRNLEGQLKIFKDFNYIKVKLQELLPLVNRALNKAKPTVTKDFVNFIEINVKLAIQSAENFKKGFLPHFQALIGYYKG